MKFKVTIASLALLIANSVSAQSLAYYTIEESNIKADGANYGAFPVAMSDDGTLIASYSLKAALSTNIDIGLPFTFNRECQYDNIICELEFYGSESAEHPSYLNAYKAWRNAQSNASSASNSYSSYMFANIGNEAVKPYDLGGNNTDVKVTDIYHSEGESYIIGYSSAAYVAGQRDFVRRAFIKASSGVVVQLLPNFTSNGGFSSAYKVTEVDGKILVVGHASVSYPQDSTDYFNDCYNSNVDDEHYDLNELVRCPGFDTQAWVWDVTDIVKEGAVPTDKTGQALATTWLENNSVNYGNLTFSASAFDINEIGIAVGTSTFEYRNNSEGARQRAIIMTPTGKDTEGNLEYAAPVELSAVTNDIGDQKELIYNAWALTVSDNGLITGNRQYATAKGRNQAVEFFVYDNESTKIKFPLKDKKVATKKQSIENGSQTITKSGANSRAYSANESGWIVGEVDDFDQVDPVYNGSPRGQAAFLLDNNTDQVWLINDLICSKNNEGAVTAPRIRIRSARVINDSGIVLAEGFSYSSDEEYKYKTNGKFTTFKLTPNPLVASPNDSPNCWDSSLLQDSDVPYERQGAAMHWILFFMFPLLFIRRFSR